MAKLTLGQLAEITGAELHGDAGVSVDGVETLDRATASQLAFLNAKEYRPLLPETGAGVVILAADDLADCPVAALVTDNPYLAYALAAQALTQPSAAPTGVHFSAVVDDSAVLGTGVYIGAQCTIGAGVELGEGVFVGPNCVVESGCRIGRDTRLVSNVTVREDCVLGQRCIVQPSAVIGADGFGFANDNGRWVKVPQLGRVVIGDDVEIGACTTVDRGAVHDTVIDDGVKLDNQIQIAHNVKVGKHTAMAAGVGVSGSTQIGAYCTLAGAVGVAGHLTLVDHVHVAAMTGVAGSLLKPGVYASTVTAVPHEKWRRNFARIRQLDSMAKRIKALEKRLADLDPQAS